MLSEEGHQLQDPGGTGDPGVVEDEKGMVMEMGGDEEATESEPLHPTRRQRKANKAKELKEAKEVFEFMAKLYLF